MTCPNCHAEVGEGKKFCGNCGAAIRIAAAPHAGTISPARHCPKCGGEIQPGKRFCGRCGSALATDTPETQLQIPAAPPAPTPSPAPPAPPVRVEPLTPPITTPPPLPPALTATVRMPAPRPPVSVPGAPPIEEKPCPHCGAPLRVGAKFCKQCGKSPMEGVTPVVAPPVEAPRPLEVPPAPVAAPRPPQVPPAPAVIRPPVTAPPHPLVEAKKGNLIRIVAGLSMLVVLGASIGYLKFHKHAPSQQASTANPPAASSANSATQQPVATQPENASQEPPATPIATSNPEQSSGPIGTPPIPPESRPPVSKSRSGPPTPAAALYQQAHAKAEEAFAAERYIDPPDDCALSWARTAKQQGDPGAAEIEERVLGMMARKVQAARAARNYDQSVALLTRLASLFPDHPELQQLAIAAQAEQQQYARQLQRQQQPQR